MNGMALKRCLVRTARAVACTALAAWALQGCAIAGAETPGRPVTVVTLLDIVPDVNVPNNEEAAQALFKAYVPSVAGERGLVAIRIWRETERGNHFVMVETWNSIDDFDRHTTRAGTKAFRTALQGYIGSPYDQRVLR